MTRPTIKSLLEENEALRKQLAVLKEESGPVELIDVYTLLFAEQILTGKKSIANASPKPIEADDWD